MRWITRENVKIDRVACPWLIKRFVDPNAEFRFVPEADLLTIAKQEDATSFDATCFPEVALNHRGVRCTFEAILEDFKLTDLGLERLARIVRAADVKGRNRSRRKVSVSAPSRKVTAIFVGYVVGGLVGSVVATVGIFLPSFLLVTLAAPQLVRLGR